MEGRTWRAEWRVKRGKPLCACLCQELNNWYKHEPGLVSPERFGGCYVYNKGDYERAAFSFYLLLSEIKQASSVEMPRLISVSSCSPEITTFFFSELSCSFINTIGLSTNHCIKNNVNLIVPFCFNQEYLPYAWQKGTILNGRIFEMLPKCTFQFLTLIKTTLSCHSMQFCTRCLEENNLELSSDTNSIMINLKVRANRKIWASLTTVFLNDIIVRDVLYSLCCTKYAEFYWQHLSDRCHYCPCLNQH